VVLKEIVVIEKYYLQQTNPRVGDSWCSLPRTSFIL